MFFEVSFGLSDFGHGWRKLRLQITVVNFKQRVAFFYLIAPLDVYRSHYAGGRRADGDVFGAGLHDTRAVNIPGERRIRRRGLGRNDGRSTIALQDNYSCDTETYERQNGEHVFNNHCSPSLPLPSVTSTIFPSSICAMRSAKLKMRGSWVTTMSARSVFFATSRNSRITSRPVSWSRLLVGSSQTINCGS